MNQRMSYTWNRSFSCGMTLCMERGGEDAQTKGESQTRRAHELLLIFSCKRWCLLDPLETRLTECTTSISWLLGRGLDESDPMPEPLYTSGLDELWAHTMLQVCCSPLCKGWTPVPFAADRCCLLGLPSLTQHHKCFIIYLNSFFISLFWVFQRILLTIKIVLIIAWYQLHNNKRIHWLSTGRKG